MNKNKSIRTAVIIAVLLCTFFTLQLLAQKHKYNQAVECLANCDYTLALEYLGGLPTYKDSKELETYAAIMKEYNPDNFQSVYLCYHDLKDISCVMSNSEISDQFIRAQTEISTIYQNYNLLSLCK